MPIAAAVSVALHVGVAVGALAVGAWREHREAGGAALAGDTFEVPAPETVAVVVGDDGPAEAPEDESENENDTENASAAERTATPPASTAATPEAHDPVASAAPERTRQGKKRARHPAFATADPSAAETASSSSGSNEVYGAVGERSAVDLMTSFVHAFPQAASGDPVWLNVPFGKSGEADVVIAIDASGSYARASVTGAGNDSPLFRGVQRTLALIRGRSFTSPSLTLHMHLVANVSPDQHHDGAESSVFAIGRTFQPRGGTAFFALAVGRRVDLSVTVR